jgi:hypothetical protein
MTLAMRAYFSKKTDSVGGLPTTSAIEIMMTRSTPDTAGHQQQQQQQQSVSSRTAVQDRGMFEVLLAVMDSGAAGRRLLQLPKRMIRRLHSQANNAGYLRRHLLVLLHCCDWCRGKRRSACCWFDAKHASCDAGQRAYMPSHRILRSPRHRIQGPW